MTSWETRGTRPREDGHTIQQREASGRRTHHPTKGNKKEDKLGDKLEDKLGDKLENKLGDKGDKTSGRWTHHPTKRNKKGDNRRQGGRQTHHLAKGDKLGVKLGDKLGDKGQGLEKADTPSNKGKENKDKLGDRPWEDGHTIPERETRMETSWETS